MKRVVFFGTPSFAVPFLDALYGASDFDVVAVVTQPDKAVGRKQELEPSAVKLRALELDIPALELKTLKHDIPQTKIKKLNADLFVVVAYGKIIPQEILDLVPSINVHPSLLPKYRGPSPMQTTIANGDNKTGVTIMLLDAEMDHGPILAQYEIPLDGTENYTELETKIHTVGPELLVRTLEDYVAGKIEPIVQNDNAATYCNLIDREDGRIDWIDSAEDIERKFRAFNPWPGVFTELEGQRVKLLEFELTKADPIESGYIQVENETLLVGTGTNPIKVSRLQPAGKKPMTASEFVNGHNNLVKFD